MAAAFEVDLRRLDQFSAVELYALLKLRVDVFVVEQECPYPELDGKDLDALHLRLLANGELLAAARIFPPKEDGESARIGRVVTAPAHRRKGLGDAVMREALAACTLRFGNAEIALSAQSHLQRFYSGFGFEITSEEYLEDGIRHVDMLRRT